MNIRDAIMVAVVLFGLILAGTQLAATSPTVSVPTAPDGLVQIVMNLLRPDPIGPKAG